MTPNEAISIHMQWRMTLKLHLSQREMVPADAMQRIRQETACLIGRWLTSPELASMRQTSEYMELHASHSLFHRQMLRVADKINARAYEEAERLLDRGGEFEAASRRLGNAIMSAGAVKMLPLSA